MPNPVGALSKIKKMFSPLEKAVVAHKLESMPSAQWAAYIKANAPKSAKKEAIAVKLDELLARQPKVTKAEIVQHIKDNSPKIKTKLLKDKPYTAGDISDHVNIEPDGSGGYNYLDSEGDLVHNARNSDEMVNYLNELEGAKYAEHVLPGGENYKEMLLSLPRNPSNAVIRSQKAYEIKDANGQLLASGQLPMSPRMLQKVNNNPDWVVREFEQPNPNDLRRDPANFQSGHYDDPNILAHMRMNDRPTAEGKKALFLEELQSDWAQQGRRQGFKPESIESFYKSKAGDATPWAELDDNLKSMIRNMYGNETSTPRAPYVEDTGDWTALGLKKAIEHAVEHGHDSIAWTTGAQQADRYNLAKQIDSIHHSANPDGTYNFSAIKNGREVASQEGLMPNELSEHLGEELSAKIIGAEGNPSVAGTSIGWQPEASIYGEVDDAAPQYKTLSGLDLEVGGEGMKGYYDQIMPQTANDILKSMGVTERVKPIGIQMHSIETNHVPGTQAQIDEAQDYFGFDNMDNVTLSGVSKSLSPVESVQHMGFDITPEIREKVMNEGLPAFGGGGVVKAAAKGLREMAEQYIKPKAAPAVNRIDMNYKDVTKRVPELTKAANLLDSGEITASEYDKLVNSLKPVTPYSFVPAPATYEDAMRALTKNKQPMFGKASEIPAGEQTDLRLDIPAYKDHGVWVNSIHRKDAPTVYDSVSSVKNATMIGSPEKALKVAKGGPKAPFAVIRGEWNPISQEDAVKQAQENLASGEWTQVGYDPERHGYFYDRNTMEPIAGAEEVLQIGPLVIAKNPAYAAKAEQKFGAGGVVKATAKEMADLLKLYHGGRKFEQWNPKMIGMGEGAGRRNPLMAQGPGLYAGDTTDLAKIYLKYGGDDPALTELSVDPSNIINYHKKMSPEHLEKVKEAESRLDALGLRTSNYGLQNAWLGGRASDPQRVRDILVNSGVDGLQQYLNPNFGTEFSIFNPDIIKRVRTMDSSEYAEGGPVHMDEGGLNVRASGDYGNFDSEGSSGSHYKVNTDVDILNKYGFGVTKEGQVFKMPERTYTYEDGYTETMPARKIKRDDISELRARYTTDDGVQYGVGRQPLAKGWSGYRTDPRTQATIGVNVSPYYKGINYTKNFAEGGKVEAGDDVDYDAMYEFKNKPAFADGGEVHMGKGGLNTENDPAWFDEHHHNIDQWMGKSDGGDVNYDAMYEFR